MENPSDNIFELGLLYKCIQALRKVQMELANHSDKTTHKDIEKVVVKIKRLLCEEIEKL